LSGERERERDPASAAPAATHERLRVLARVAELLVLFGVANDAEDHQSAEEAVGLRARARSGLRSSLEEHPFVGELLPELGWRLEGPPWRLEAAGWWNQYDLVRAEIRRLEGEDAEAPDAREKTSPAE
jgi:hypothetical protein